MQARKTTRLSAVDAAQFRRAFRQRAMLETSHRRFQQQLLNLDCQIETLEDAPALDHSHGSLASSVGQQRLALTRSILATSSAGIAALRAPAPAAEVDSLAPDDIDGLSSELDALMKNTSFLEQFNADELNAVRIKLLAAPSVSLDQPLPRLLA